MAETFLSRLETLISDTDTAEGKPITQEHLASTVNITRQSISKYMKGKASPKLDNAVGIAKYFNVSLDYLAGLSDYKSLSADIKQACMYTGLSEKAVYTLNENKSDKRHPLKMKIISQLIESKNLEEIAVLLEHALVCIHQYNFLYEDDDVGDAKTNMLATDEFQFNKTVTSLYPAIIEKLSTSLKEDIKTFSFSRWEMMLENAEITIEKMQEVINAVGESNWKAYQAKKLQKKITDECAEKPPK